MGAPDRPASRMQQRVFVAIWIALAVFVVLRAGGRDRGVIIDHREFGRRLISREDLYAPYLEDKPLHPVYPPSFGLLTAPFAMMGEREARYAWAIAQVLAMFVILRTLGAALRRHAPDLGGHRHAILLLTIAVMGRYILRDTHGGGGNLINLAFALAAYGAAESGRATTGALLLGFSLATKPTTAILLPVLAVMGHLRLAFGSLFAGTAFLGLSLLINGHRMAPLDRWVEGAMAYGTTTDIFAPPHLGLPPFTWMNQCLRCMVVRYLGVVPEPFAQEVPGFVPGLGMSNAATAWIARIASLGIVLVTMAVAHRARSSGLRRDLAIAAALTAGALVSPISWKAHHVALLPAIFALSCAAWRGSRTARGGLLVFFLACSAGGGDVVGDSFKQWEQSSYLATIGALALWGWSCRKSATAMRTDTTEAR